VKCNFNREFSEEIALEPRGNEGGDVKEMFDWANCEDLS
jgi:hypothetical protein